jgi:phosphatidate cytidylyltransferase
MNKEMWKKLDAYRRLPTALVVLAAVVALIHFSADWLMAAVLNLLILVALFEFYGLARKKGLYPQAAAGVILSLLLALPFIFPSVPLALALLVCFLAAGLIYLIRFNSLERMMVFPQSLALTFLGAVYLSFTLNHFLPLRREFGPWAIYFLFAAVFAGDTGAFLVGSLIGRHKMFPLASPHKTWEGAAGGLVFGVLGAVAARELFFGALSLEQAVIFGLLLQAVAQLSDPLESLFKRAAGVKDSGRIFPGHGGLLDRVDSLILAGPSFYYLMRYFK